MCAIDVRAFSSDWTMACPVHGPIVMAIQFGGDWERTYCQTCFEAHVASVAHKVSVTANPGAPEPEVQA